MIMYGYTKETPEMECFFMLTEFLSDTFNENALSKVEANLGRIRKIARYYEKNIGHKVFSPTEEQSAKLFVRMHYKVEELVRAAK